MTAFRGALVGCGFFAVNHMHGWAGLENVQIVAICDRDPERLKIVGDQFGIARRYQDAAAMLADGGIDFVDIATTVSTHRQLVELAVSHNIPVICQKPFALNMDDAKAMVKAAETASVSLMVHENFRWQTPILAVSQAILSGAIGAPFWGRVSFRSGFDVFAAQPYLAEGNRFIIEDLGIHSLDIARFLFGDVSRITARTARINPAIKGEDVATMLLDHDNGMTSIVDVSYATHLPVEPFPETFVEVDGPLGTIRLTKDYRLVVHNAQGTTETIVAPNLLAWASRPWHNIQESVALIQAHWIARLAEGRDADTSGHDNLKTFALVEAAYASAARGETINLADILA